jgi:hypothetical protein
MQRLLRLAALAGCLTLSAYAEDPRPFSQTLTPEQKARLGLSGLSAAQLAELDAAVSAYGHGETTVAVQQATQQAEQKADVRVQQAEQKAAETAVADYKKKEEPGVIARSLAVFKHKEEEAKIERFTAHVVGQFRGWNGGTYFPLDNGQVWRQSGTESVEMAPEQNAEVEIYQSNNGYWRLRYHGAWITVKRLQ